MKKLLSILVLTITISFALSAQAEDFTLTRGDGKVFKCTDDGVSGPAPGRPKVLACGCSSDSKDYGLVLGRSAAADCAKMSGGRGRLYNCKSNDWGDNVSCLCTSTSNSYGQIAAPVRDADTLVSSCRSISNDDGKLAYCDPV